MVDTSGVRRDAEKLDYSDGFLEKIAKEWSSTYGTGPDDESEAESVQEAKTIRALDMFNAKYGGLTPAPDTAPPCAVCELPVTEEMYLVGLCRLHDSTTDLSGGKDMVQAIYRAMAAVAPLEHDRTMMLLARAERDIALKSAEDWKTAWEKERNFQLNLWKTKLATAANECAALRDQLAATQARLAVEEPGAHDYNGPTKEVTNEHGRVTREAISDPAHEQFHRAVGDVIAGKIIPAAREQMRRELDKAPSDPQTTASTSKPMPGTAVSWEFTHSGAGIKLP